MAEAKPQRKEGTQGLAIIITNKHGTDEYEELYGTDEDRSAWTEAMVKLQFDYRNQTKSNLSEVDTTVLMNKCSEIELNESKFVIFAFSGHGFEQGVISQNGKEMYFEHLLAPLFEGELAKKHKLIFLDSCRRKDSESKRPRKEVHFPQHWNDYFIFYPCLPGNTIKDQVGGSCFSRVVTEWIVKPSDKVVDMADKAKTDLQKCRFCKEGSHNPTFSEALADGHQDAWRSLFRSPPDVDTPSMNLNITSLLKKYRNSFKCDLDSHAICRVLEFEDVISSKVRFAVEKVCKEDGNVILFQHFQKQGDPETLQQFCKVVIEVGEHGYAMMCRLGQNLQRDLKELCSQ